MNKHKKLVLVDGSSYLYRAFHALPPLTAPDNRPTAVIYGVINMLKALIKQEKPNYFGVVFDAKGKTFRHEIYPEYKAQRPPMPSELALQIPPLFELIKLSAHPLIQINGVEADDVIGTLSWQAAAQNYEVVISTGDKDLMQLVNEKVSLYDSMKKQHYDWDGVKKKIGVTPEQVVDYLTLTGDKSDNIPGVHGVGPKTAVKWLEAYGSLDNLLTHRDELTGKVAENLKNAAGQLPLITRLVTIDTNLPLDIALQDLQTGTADETSLAKQYKSLGFKTLLKDLSFATDNTTHNTVENKTVEDKKLTHQHNHRLILDHQSLHQWIERLQREQHLFIRLETTSPHYTVAEIVGMTLATMSGDTVYVPVAHTYAGVPKQISLNDLLVAVKPLLTAKTIKKSGHDLKYMRNVLAKYDINLQECNDDSMLKSYVYNSVTTPHSIENLSRYYLEKSLVTYNDLTGKSRQKRTFNQIALKEACMYSCAMTNAGIQLHRFFNKKMEHQAPQTEVYQQIELPLLPVLSDMEQRGVCIATEVLHKQDKELSEKIKILQKQAQQIVGKTFNLDSPSQIREILFQDAELPVIKKTPKGEASTAEDVLQELAYEHELPQLILDYRALKKLQSTYTNKLPQMINTQTQRIHTSYHQAATLTGRLSSSDPNLQNIPVRSAEGRKIRQAFIPVEGYCLLAADYSQIELRIMAHFSKDKRLCEAFEAGLDIHTTTAAEVLNTPLDQVTPEQRRLAKAINFGLIYNISAFGLAKQLKINREAAQQYIHTYFARYPGIKKYMSDITQIAERQGYVDTLFGRRIYLPDIRVPRRRLHARRAAINAPMQGTAADIIKRAMINLHNRLQKTDVRAAIVMQVHDELVLEVAQEDVESVSEYCREIMSSAANLSVPLIVSIGVGNNWDEAH